MAFQMTARRFANLDRKNASSHLEKHRSYLASHDFLKPILATTDPPEMIFDRCKHALFVRWMNSKNEEANAQLANKERKTPSSRYTVRIFGMVDGEVSVLLAKHMRVAENGLVESVMKWMSYPAADYASAERLADRRLLDREDSVHAEITNNDGKAITTRIERQDGIARVLAKPKHAVVKGGKRTADLHWKPKSHASRNVTRWNIMR